MSGTLLATDDSIERIPRSTKAANAFRTISEVADELDVAQHVLRFWESKFPQVRPLKRGGGRRYYRPEDIVLLRRIRSLLYEEGYTIKGVQKLLRVRRRGTLEEPGTADNAVIDETAPATIHRPTPPPTLLQLEPRPLLLEKNSPAATSAEDRPDAPSVPALSRDRAWATHQRALADLHIELDALSGLVASMLKSLKPTLSDD